MIKTQRVYGTPHLVRQYIDIVELILTNQSKSCFVKKPRRIFGQSELKLYTALIRDLVKEQFYLRNKKQMLIDLHSIPLEPRFVIQTKRNRSPVREQTQ